MAPSIANPRKPLSASGLSAFSTAALASTRTDLSSNSLMSERRLTGRLLIFGQTSAKPAAIGERRSIARARFA
jgi:hypothetical protein